MKFGAKYQIRKLLESFLDVTARRIACIKVHIRNRKKADLGGYDKLNIISEAGCVYDIASRAEKSLPREE